MCAYTKIYLFFKEILHCTILSNELKNLRRFLYMCIETDKTHCSSLRELLQKPIIG